jgi:hypothetical protein
MTQRKMSVEEIRAVIKDHNAMVEAQAQGKLTLDDAIASLKRYETVFGRPFVVPIEMLDHANIIDLFVKIVKQDVRAEATVGQQMQARLCLCQLVKNGSGYAKFVLENVLKVKDWNEVCRE